MKTQKIIELKSGKDDLILLEGVHAIKHAFRFGAEFELVFCKDKPEAMELAKKHSSDLVEFLNDNLVELGDEIHKIFPQNHHGLLGAVAHKKSNADNFQGLSVWLESPNSINNLGATIRVLAARGVKNLIVSGAEFNAWHKDALRAGAGLHFALDNIVQMSDTSRAVDFLRNNKYKIYALDPEGENLKKSFDLSENICLVFGTESVGLTQETKDNADKLLRIPMQDKVSSMNLATSVAATLYMNINT